MHRWSVALALMTLAGFGGGWFATSLLQGQPAVAQSPVREPVSFRDVVKKVLPAVVSIEMRKAAPKPVRQPRRPRPGNDQPESPEELRRFFEQFRNDEDDNPRGGFGSGFLVDAKGVILTNNHVVEGAEQVEVTLKDGRKFVSSDIKTDPKTDLALVRISARESLPFLEFGDSDAMEIGDRVLAVGAPFGLTGSVTSGIISAKGRNLRMNMYEDFLQTDAAINPGNSGGPLVNLDGRVIAINSAIKSRNGGFQGVGMAIASNLARDVMQQLLRDGVVKRGYLGVQIRDLEPELAQRLGASEEGAVQVTTVFENAPAGKGGVQEGDVITTIGGKPVKDGRALQGIVARLPLGQPTEVRIVRDGKPLAVKVTISEQPKDLAGNRTTTPRPGRRQTLETTRVKKLGIEAADMTADVAESLGFRAGTTGAFITAVEAESLAAESGLGRGMVVTKVEGTTVKTVEELTKALENADLKKGVLVQAKSALGGTVTVLVKEPGK